MSKSSRANESGAATDEGVVSLRVATIAPIPRASIGSAILLRPPDTCAADVRAQSSDGVCEIQVVLLGVNGSTPAPTVVCVVKVAAVQLAGRQLEQGSRRAPARSLDEGPQSLLPVGAAQRLSTVRLSPSRKA
eukprot:27848-Prymnesium_polylepis.3